MPQAIAEGFFVSLASFAQPPTTQGPTGNFVGAFTPVAGLQNLACQDSPESLRVVASNEKRSIADIQSGLFRHVLMAGNYPALVGANGLGWQVTIVDPNGVTTLYTLLGSDFDSQDTQTRCSLQKVTL